MGVKEFWNGTLGMPEFTQWKDPVAYKKDFKGTLAVVITYGVIALLIVIISSIKPDYFMPYMVFLVSLFLGMIMVVCFMLYSLAVFKEPPKTIRSNALGDFADYSCPDFYRLEYDAEHDRKYCKVDSHLTPVSSSKNKIFGNTSNAVFMFTQSNVLTVSSNLDMPNTVQFLTTYGSHENVTDYKTKIIQQDNRSAYKWVTDGCNLTHLFSADDFSCQFFPVDTFGSGVNGDSEKCTFKNWCGLSWSSLNCTTTTSNDTDTV